MKKQATERGIDLTTADWSAELEARVQCRLDGQLHDFRVVAVGNGLSLRGHAQTYYAKQLAQQLVMEATRLPVVANEIEVS